MGSSNAHVTNTSGIGGTRGTTGSFFTFVSTLQNSQSLWKEGDLAQVLYWKARGVSTSWLQKRAWKQALHGFFQVALSFFVKKSCQLTCQLTIQAHSMIKFSQSRKIERNEKKVHNLSGWAYVLPQGCTCSFGVCRLEKQGRGLHAQGNLIQWHTVAIWRKDE